MEKNLAEVERAGNRIAGNGERSLALQKQLRKALSGDTNLRLVVAAGQFSRPGAICHLLKIGRRAIHTDPPI